MKTVEMGLATIPLEQFLKEWPEDFLAAEKELLITRNGEAIAKLVALEKTPEGERRPQFDPEAHRNWMKETWGKDAWFDGQRWLDEDRNDRA